MTLGAKDLILCAGSVSATPFLDRLEAARAAGFTAVSILANEYEKLMAAGISAAEVRMRVADAGLSIAEFDPIGRWLPNQVPHPGVAAWLTDMLVDYTPEIIFRNAEAVGARSVTVVELFDVPFDADRMTEGFDRVCALGREHGVLAHLEFMPMGGIPDLQSAWKIVEQVDHSHGGLLVDSWHMFRSGSSLDDLARIPGDKIFAIQINDAPAEPAADPLEETAFSRLLPGEGSFDLRGMMRALDATGTTAPIGVECMSTILATLPVDEIAWRCANAAHALLNNGE